MNLARTKAMVMMICVFCRAQRIAYTNYRPYGLHGFDDTEAAILETVDLVRNHPLIPKDINVCGYIMDSVTGGLRAIAQDFENNG